MIKELRLLIAEWLLGVILSIAPTGPEGDFLRVTIYNYFRRAVAEAKSKLNGNQRIR